MNLEKLSAWERGSLSRSGNELHYPSPNRKTDVYLQYAGEVRFGPAYFNLIVGGTRIRDRLFGGEIFWSNDSKYFAVQEWLSTEESQGPHTRLVLFNAETRQESAVKECMGGFVSALRFYPESFTYQEERGPARHLWNAAYDELANWKTIA
ncbi:MAG: hypothetical protein HC794_02405 [Nitrospiraceae bacterium]|nr:hypothetical protein [Nitrospiraceae bacterium]